MPLPWLAFIAALLPHSLALRDFLGSAAQHMSKPRTIGPPQDAPRTADHRKTRRETADHRNTRTWMQKGGELVFQKAGELLFQKAGE